MPRPRSNNKYNARRSGGFDSQLEGAFHELLVSAEEEGLVKYFLYHPPAVKFPADVRWNVDFLVQPTTGLEFYVEVKGLQTPVFRLKWKMYKWFNANDILMVSEDDLLEAECQTREVNGLPRDDELSIEVNCDRSLFVVGGDARRPKSWRVLDYVGSRGLLEQICGPDITLLW